MPVQLKLPASQRLAAMVVHTRPMLLRQRERIGLHLYYGVAQDLFPDLPSDPDAAEEVLPPDHVADFSEAQQIERLRDWLHDDLRTQPAFAKLFGRDPVFIHALALARETAQLDGEPRELPPVLIQGPSGSGKELVARAIHVASGRKGQFVAIHCAGITESLLEDTLFGHEKGAYTGAQSARTGLVSEAEHGTLFIDEVADLPPQAQVALLRFLQDQRFRSIGANHEKQANVRVICATWKPIDDLARDGVFRHDLLYRINGVRIVLPGLKDRMHEILELAEAISSDAGVNESPPLDPEATLAIRSTAWPGGLRQLDREIREAARKSQQQTIRLEHLSPERVVSFHSAGTEVRIAAAALAWSPSGRRPTLEETRTRLADQLKRLRSVEVEREPAGELELVRHIQEAFREDDPTYRLLARLLEVNERRTAAERERLVLEALLDTLPSETADDLVRARLDGLDAEDKAADTELDAVSVEVTQRLPGLAQIFAFVYSIPGIEEHQRSALLTACAQVVAIVAQLLPEFVGLGVRKITGNRLESLLIEDPEPTDPLNPFNHSANPADRSVEDWKWLAEKATSIADAERLSGCAKNTIRKYFNIHSLSINRGRS